MLKIKKIFNPFFSSKKREIAEISSTHELNGEPTPCQRKFLSPDELKSRPVEILAPDPKEKSKLTIAILTQLGGKEIRYPHTI